MPREIYNEGRVLGYSTYELYVKHALAENPDIEPASEKEWLAAQIGHGTSMVLKVPTDTVSGVHSIDFPLPEDSFLATANVIVASIFFGKCKWTGNWANTVTDYGQGISNSSTSSPTTQTDAKNYPKQTIEEFNDSQKKEFLNYMRIQDGIVIQPGAWTAAGSTPPAKDFTPNLKNGKVPVVRITVASKVTKEFYVLLTGFTNKSILSSIAKMSTGSVGTEKWYNGDFLGPEVYPWANKIVFMHPPIASYYLRKYLASGHENRKGIQNTDAGTARVDNLKIDHNEDDINTIFTSSYLYSADGISIVGPTTPGGDITIGSKTGSVGSAANYIKVTQRHTDASHAQTTDLQHSEIVSGPGVAYHRPATAAEDVKFSAMVGTANNFLKVEQSTKSSVTAAAVTNASSNNLIGTSELNDASKGYTTLLTASPIKTAGSDITVIPPSTPGGDTTLVVNLVSANNYLNISRAGQGSAFTTTLKPSTFAGSKYVLIEQPATSGGVVTVSLDFDKLYGDIVAKLKQDNDFLQSVRNWLQANPTFIEWADGRIKLQIDSLRQELLDQWIRKLIWMSNSLKTAINNILSKLPGGGGATGNRLNEVTTGSNANIPTSFPNGAINYHSIVPSDSKIAVGTLNIESLNDSGNAVQRYIRTNAAGNGDMRVK